MGWPRRLQGLVVPLGVVTGWWLMSVSSPVAAAVAPDPVTVLTALWGELSSGALLAHVGASLGRSLGGYAAAAAIGIPLGLAMGVQPAIRALLGAPVELLRPISSIAWIPLAILWFGIGLKSVVFVIFIVCVFIILLNTLGATMEVETDMLKVARTLGAGRRLIFQKVVIPSALPGMLLGLRVTLAAAWGGVIVAEMIASETGVGYMIHHAQVTFRPSLVIGGMVVIGVVGYLLNRGFVALERRLVPWARG